jgi:hypothetical protein
MGTYNNQNLYFGIIFFITSVISFMRGETIALVSSISMSLIFFLIYITLKILKRSLNL